ncbi:MAG: DUF2378 family protein [Archangium sp.]
MDADTKEALRQRIQLATEEDQISGMFCGSTFQAIRELLGPELAESVRATASPVRQWVHFARYPVAGLLRLVDAAADLAESRGDLAYAQAVEEIGGSVTRAVQSTPLSKSYQLVAGNSVHDRLALSLGAARVIVTYGERKYERLGPTQARLVFRREMVGPSWMLGAYLSTARSFPGLQMTVTLEQCREFGLDFQLLCSW